MTNSRSKVERALGALREEVWSDLQHRRGAERLGLNQEAPARRGSRRWLGVALAAAAFAAVAVGVLHRTMTPAALGSEAGGARTMLRDGSVVDVAR
ncbi:MAG TPA: hypothetical protein VNW92_02300, partial [Polyangiaceae bacterium]|nr:hypothetical protein [Polyangiaceae bacterium]